MFKNIQQCSRKENVRGAKAGSQFKFGEGRGCIGIIQFGVWGMHIFNLGEVGKLVDILFEVKLDLNLGGGGGAFLYF